MKKTKPKSSKAVKGTSKTTPKKAAKKELESGIAERFLDVVVNLGHDAERIAKDIKKMSKEIAKKLSDKIQNDKNGKKASSKKAAKAQKETIKREVKASKKEVTKAPSRAEKVVAKVVAKPASKPVSKRAPRIVGTEDAPVQRIRRSSKPVPEAEAGTPKPRGRKPAAQVKSGDAASKAPVQRRTRRTVASKTSTNPAAPAAGAESNKIENQAGPESGETKSE